jgi:hypothetical protein
MTLSQERINSELLPSTTERVVEGLGALASKHLLEKVRPMPPTPAPGTGQTYYEVVRGV